MISLTRGIRFKVTAVALAVLTVILVVGGVVLVASQRASLTATVDQALIQRANDLMAIITTDDDLGGRFPTGAGEGFAQLIGADGSVLASTPNLSGLGPLPVELRDGRSDSIRTISDLADDDDSFRLLTRRLDGFGLLHVGTEYEVVTDAAETLIGLLAVVFPALLLVTGGLIWWLVGRTLSPVERIRSEVAEIESSELYRRVPEPGTGDEIDRLAKTMNKMLGRLQNSAQRQQRFVSDASHELRSPLTRVRSALEVVRLPPVSEADHTGDEALLGDVIEMQRIVEDLLYLARADEGRAVPHVQPLDLDDVVLSEARRLQAEDRVLFDLAGVSGAHVVGDRVQLRRAIRNLLENAQRHAEHRVTVTLTEQGDAAVLTIADDGPGIPETDSERVFERFTRLDDSRTSETGGSGLGLSIAREIVRGHGGSLKLTSLETAGATFELRLPLA